MLPFENGSDHFSPKLDRAPGFGTILQHPVHRTDRQAVIPFLASIGAILCVLYFGTTSGGAADHSRSFDTGQPRDLINQLLLVAGAT